MKAQAIAQYQDGADAIVVLRIAGESDPKDAAAKAVCAIQEANLAVQLLKDVAALGLTNMSDETKREIDNLHQELRG